METYKSENEGSLTEYDVTRKATTGENFDPEAQVVQVRQENNAHPLQWQSQLSVNYFMDIIHPFFFFRTSLFSLLQIYPRQYCVAFCFSFNILQRSCRSPSDQEKLS